MASGAPYDPLIEADGEGPPVVLVHGTPLDVRCWDALVPTLAQGLSVIRYDVRGHGTAAGCAMPGSYEVLADDLLSVLDGLGLERAHVVGHSFGGQIAQAFALRAPKRLISLTVVCARARPFPAFAATAAEIEANGVEALVEPTLARWFTAQALAQDAPGEEAAVIRYVRERLAGADAVPYAAALRLIAGFDVLARLGEIDVPARFVAAERDAISTPHELTLSAGAVQHGEFSLFGDAGHLLPLEHPLVLAELLAETLAEPLPASCSSQPAHGLTSPSIGASRSSRFARALHRDARRSDRRGARSGSSRRSHRGRVRAGARARPRRAARAAGCAGPTRAGQAPA
jgi:3-oxoadipate enol-lactonase